MGTSNRQLLDPKGVSGIFHKFVLSGDSMSQTVSPCGVGRIILRENCNSTRFRFLHQQSRFLSRLNGQLGCSFLILHDYGRMAMRNETPEVHLKPDLPTNFYKIRRESITTYNGIPGLKNGRSFFNPFSSVLTSLRVLRSKRQGRPIILAQQSPDTGSRSQ